MTAITVEACKFRSRIIWTVVVLFAGSSVWGTREALKATSSVDSHEKVLTEVIKRIDASLYEIKTEQGKQREMIEDLWQKGNGR